MVHAGLQVPARAVLLGVRAALRLGLPLPPPHQEAEGGGQERRHGPQHAPRHLHQHGRHRHLRGQLHGRGPRAHQDHHGPGDQGPHNRLLNTGSLLLFTLVFRSVQLYILFADGLYEVHRSLIRGNEFYLGFIYRTHLAEYFLHSPDCEKSENRYINIYRIRKCLDKEYKCK